MMEVESERRAGFGFGARHVQGLLMFICLTICFGIRVTMSVAIVAMTDRTTPEEKGIMIFDWSKQIQGIILSSFFWGYTCMQLPGGNIAHRYGARYLIAFALLSNGIISLITPWACKFGGWKVVCACRVILGLSQGAIFPSLHTLNGKWIPLEERSRLHNFVYGGAQFGTMIFMPLSGLLAASKYGWPSVFYVTGIFGCVFGAIWLYFSAESPATHKSISDEEKAYIQKSLGQLHIKKPMKIPWKKIFTSKSMLAVCVSHIGGAWTNITLFTEVPSYLSKVMGVDIKSNGVLSALPFFGYWVSGLFFGYITDYFINKRVFSLTVARKIVNTIGYWGGGVGFLLLALLPWMNVTLAVFLLTVAASLKSASMAGYHVNHIDIAPNFAGTLMSVTNTAANTFNIIAPNIAGYIVKDQHNGGQWKIVFGVVAAVSFITNLIYIILGSFEQAPWNEPEYTDTEKDKSTGETLMEKSDNKIENSIVLAQ